MTRILLLCLVAATHFCAVGAAEQPPPTPAQIAEDLAAGSPKHLERGKGQTAAAYIEAAFEPISKALTANKPEVVSNAIELIAALQPEGAERLAPLLGRVILESKKVEHARLVVHTLARMGDPGLAQAAEILKHFAPALNETADMIGIDFSYRARPLVPLYATILENSNGDKATVACVLDALKNISVGLEPAKAALLKLADAEKDPNAAAGRLSLIAIGASDLAPCRNAFMAILKDERIQEVDFAGLGLVRLNDASPEAIAAFKQRAAMHGGSELGSCVEMLASLRSKNASEFFRGVAGSDADAQIRGDALSALLDAGESFDSVRPIVLNFLKSGDWALRAGGARAIVRAKAHDPELAALVADYFEAAHNGESSRKKAAEQLAAKMNEFEAKRENMTEKEQLAFLQELKQLKSASVKATAVNDSNAAAAVRSAPGSFVVWGNAVLAAHASDPGEQLSAIWNEFKHSKSSQFLSEPLEALSLLKPGNPALIEEIRQATTGARSFDRQAELLGLLACWNVDTAGRLSDLKAMMDVAQTPNAAIVWIERVGKDRAASLFGDLKRWATDSPRWDNRIYAQLLLRRWGLQDK